jgi:hypothetical protein
MIEILSASLTGHPWDHVFDCWLDLPTSGIDDRGHDIAVSGWILGQRQPVKSINLALEGFSERGKRVSGSGESLSRTWLEVPVSVMREDVLTQFEQPPDLLCGFQTNAVAGALPLSFELAVEAVFEDGQVERFARIVGRHTPIDSGVVPSLQPLLVTSLGRTGSTWLMRLLSEHPQIVARRVHPYETPASTHWLHAIDVLSRSSDLASDGRPFHFTDHTVTYGTPLSLGQEPATARWLRGPYVEQAAGFAQRAIDGFYAVVAESNGQPDARYFAEKYLPVHLRWWARNIYPGYRDLLLLRDPRDTLSSILAFNAKRGTQSFGREEVDSDVEYVQHLSGSLSQVLYVLERERDSVLVVRYEDLVLEPERELQRILDYANLDCSDEVIAEVLSRAAVDTPALAAHRTSTDPRESIGRWQRDLSPELQQACSEWFGPMLERLGYTAV